MLHATVQSTISSHTVYTYSLHNGHMKSTCVLTYYGLHQECGDHLVLVMHQAEHAGRGQVWVEHLLVRPTADVRSTVGHFFLEVLLCVGDSAGGWAAECQ